MRNTAYSEFAKENKLPKKISFEELEEMIEQDAREEESDNIALMEDKRQFD